MIKRRQSATNAKDRKQALRASSGVRREEIDALTSTLKKGRAGRKGVVIYINPIAKEALDTLARSQKKSLQVLGVEAVNQLFIRYGQKPIA
jgi:antitoxin-like ribbon-helix-helix protein